VKAEAIFLTTSEEGSERLGYIILAVIVLLGVAAVAHVMVDMLGVGLIC
jgi:hypothetical protein